jgi:hypothetical protein
MKKNNLTNPYDTSYFSTYKPNISFNLPSNGTVPKHFKIVGINMEKVVTHLANFKNELNDTIDQLASETTWANETTIALDKLRMFSVPLISELISIKLSPLQILANPVEKYKRYNNYFHIVEYKDMDLLQLMKEDINLLHSILIEMQIIRMDEQEIINFLKGVAIRLETYECILRSDKKNSTFISQNFKPSIMDQLLFDCRISTSFYRWFACHWDFAINLIHAKYFFDAAAKCFANGDQKSCAESIEKTGTLLRATSADMVFGCSMPAKTYQEFIRPSMGEGFSGNDNPHWAIFAASKKAILALPGIKDDRTINSAWSSFHEKYLQDIEVHTTIADKLVGQKPSLIIDELNNGMAEEEQDKTPATTGLRNLHYMRLAEFSFLHSYPILWTLFKPKQHEKK